MTLLLAFFRRYMVRFLPWYLVGALALVATNWLTVTIPLYLAEAIDALQAGSREVVLSRAGIIAAMGAGVIVVRTLSRVLFFTPGRMVEARVRHDLFAKLLRQQPAFLGLWPTGDLVSRASSDMTMLRLLAGYGALQVVNATAAMVLTITQMTRLSPELAGWVVVPVLVGFGITLAVVRYLFALVKRMQAQLASLSDHVLTSYQGVATIQSFVAEPGFQQRFRERNDAYLGTALKRAQLRAVVGPTLAVAVAVDVFLLLYVGGPMAVRGEISVGELVAFTTLVAYLASPLRATSFLLSILKQAQAAAVRIFEVMDPPPDRPDLPDPVPPPGRPPAIEVHGLDFAYPDAPEQPVLHQVELQVPAGGTLGVLGPTGSGKTTLLRCLARLYNPPPGTVLVDGVDVLDLDLDGWREQLSFVAQRAFLFSESLGDNVLLGQEDPARLARVLGLTALEADIDALPDGVDSPVGEAGIMLSGGQRQRVALARGLARPHVVLVLDDVLSAVDHATEHELIESLRGAGDRPTTVIVSHRVSALHHAERIVVMREGRVVDSGTHEELVARPGLYRDTWERQQDREEGA